MLAEALATPVAQPATPAPSVAPVEQTATAPKRRGRVPKVRTAANWRDVIHTCPHCGHTGPIDPDFGVKLVRGIAYKQSWCKNCRQKTNYHTRPRRYQKPTDR